MIAGSNLDQVLPGRIGLHVVGDLAQKLRGHEVRLLSDGVSILEDGISRCNGTHDHPDNITGDDEQGTWLLY